MYYRNELTEQHVAQLARSVDMRIVPINWNHAYDLAVISSTGGLDLRTSKRYADTLIGDFADSRLRVQVLIADNTRGHSNRGPLNEMRTKLGDRGIDSEILHAPEPGKPYGLNACLAAVRAPIVESVDMNKYPAAGTLRGLYEDVRDDKADLVSCRIFRPLHTQVPQYWCAGQAYAGKRWCFPGFPEVLNEDEYTHLLTLARGGSFAISDRLLYDKTPPNADEAAERIARTNAGSQQLHMLTVCNGANYYNLGDFHEGLIAQPECESGGLAGRIYKFIQSPLGYKRALYTRAKNKLAHPVAANLQEKETQFLSDLVTDPKMCAW